MPPGPSRGRARRPPTGPRKQPVANNHSHNKPSNRDSRNPRTARSSDLHQQAAANQVKRSLHAAQNDRTTATKRGRQRGSDEALPAPQNLQHSSFPPDYVDQLIQSRDSTVPPSHEEYQSWLDIIRKQREEELRVGIANGTVPDPNKRMRLEDAITPVGTCPHMCSTYEAVRRAHQRDIWAQEAVRDEHRHVPSNRRIMDRFSMVKRFARSAAGQEEQLPSDLRPPPVLKKTLEYLMGNVALSVDNLGSVHHFIWDRTRAIRNDFSIQQVSKPEDIQLAMECYEIIARFHILSLHQLAQEKKPYEEYDAQQEREQLDKTLLSLNQYYEDRKGAIRSPNEAEFRAYQIVFQIQKPTPNLEERIQSWDHDIVRDPQVQQAHKIYQAACNFQEPQGPLQPAEPHHVARSNWKNFWNLIISPATSYLLGCVAEIYFPFVRWNALRNIWLTSRPRMNVPNTGWTIQDLTFALSFDNDQLTRTYIEKFGFEIQEQPGIPDSEATVDLGAYSRYFPTPFIGQQCSAIVERKRMSRDVQSLVHSLKCTEAWKYGQVNTNYVPNFQWANPNVSDGPQGLNSMRNNTFDGNTNNSGAGQNAHMGGQDESMFIPDSRINQSPELSQPKDMFQSIIGRKGNTSEPFGNSQTSVNNTFNSMNMFGRHDATGFGGSRLAGREENQRLAKEEQARHVARAEAAASAKRKAEEEAKEKLKLQEAEILAKERAEQEAAQLRQIEEAKRQVEEQQRRQAAIEAEHLAKERAVKEMQEKRENEAKAREMQRRAEEEQKAQEQAKRKAAEEQVFDQLARRLLFNFGGNPGDVFARDGGIMFQQMLESLRKKREDDAAAKKQLEDAENARRKELESAARKSHMLKVRSERRERYRKHEEEKRLSSLRGSMSNASNSPLQLSPESVPSLPSPSLSQADPATGASQPSDKSTQSTRQAELEDIPNRNKRPRQSISEYHMLKRLGLDPTPGSLSPYPTRGSPGRTPSSTGEKANNSSQMALKRPRESTSPSSLRLQANGFLGTSRSTSTGRLSDPTNMPPPPPPKRLRNLDDSNAKDADLSALDQTSVASDEKSKSKHQQEIDELIARHDKVMADLKEGEEWYREQTSRHTSLASGSVVPETKEWVGHPADASSSIKRWLSHDTGNHDGVRNRSESAIYRPHSSQSTNISISTSNRASLPPLKYRDRPSKFLSRDMYADARMARGEPLFPSPKASRTSTTPKVADSPPKSTLPSPPNPPELDRPSSASRPIESLPTRTKTPPPEIKQEEEDAMFGNNPFAALAGEDEATDEQGDEATDFSSDDQSDVEDLDTEDDEEDLEPVTINGKGGTSVEDAIEL